MLVVREPAEAFIKRWIDVLLAQDERPAGRHLEESP